MFRALLIETSIIVFSLTTFWISTSAAETPFDREVVDAAGNVGTHTSLALDPGGNVHIAYHAESTRDLRYAFNDGREWLVETVDATGDVGRDASLALDGDGDPRIAYRDATQSALKFAANEDGDWSIQLLETGVSGTSEGTSLALDASGRAHVSYFAGDNLRYGILDGTSWTSELVDGPGFEVGEYSSLRLDSYGNPHIAYRDGNNGIAYAVKNAGNWVTDTVDPDPGLHTSLALDSHDRPRISYQSEITSDLMYATKESGDWQLETIFIQSAAQDISLTLDARGRPHVSFSRLNANFEQSLSYAVKTDNVWRAQAVDILGFTGRHTSIALNADGHPVISYYDGTNGTLKVADSRLTILSPSGREVWAVGARAYVHWDGPGPVDVLLSGDGGLAYSTVVTGTASSAVPVDVAHAPTETARIRIVGQEVFAESELFRIVSAHHPPPASFLRRFTAAGTGGERLGAFVASVDFDGDGCRDVVASAPLANDLAGRVYVYLCGGGLDETPDLVMSGEALGDLFGFPVADAGDLNNDGFGDIAAGAPFNDESGGDAGRAYVFLGGAAPDTVVDLTLTGQAAGDLFGYAVSSAGDFDGDGFGDLIVGAPLNATGGTDAGRAYLYHGGSVPNSSADLTFTGDAGDEVGVAVSGGDMNGDGSSDVAIGTKLNPGARAGRAYVLFGGPGADSSPDFIVRGEDGSDLFGVSVALTGDPNGDGFADLLVGAQRSGEIGKAYLFHGSSRPDTIPDLILYGEDRGDGFGLSSTFVGDVNDDGFDDIAVGANDSDAGGAESGRAYIYFGGPGTDAVPDAVMTGEEEETGLGSSVAPAGDVNGDGFDDLLAGAIGHASSAGRVDLYDFNRYHLLSPAGGETWNVGATETISWLGAEPADVWLSVDGGATYGALRRSAGGAESNTLALLVPHLPTRFARIRLTPSDLAVTGVAESDSLLTLDASVTLMLLLAAPAPAGDEGVIVSWSTDPGPEDLSGYRLERAPGARTAPAGWETVVSLTRETSHHDREGAPGTRYRLAAINGLGEALLLGETSVPSLRPLAAEPLPYRTGAMTITFATAGGLGGGPGLAEVGLFDVSGRLVRWIARGNYPAGFQQVSWDGRNEAGRTVAGGMYFLRSASGGQVATLKVAVVR